MFFRKFSFVLFDCRFMFFFLLLIRLDMLIIFEIVASKIELDAKSVSKLDIFCLVLLIACSCYYFINL